MRRRACASSRSAIATIRSPARPIRQSPRPSREIALRSGSSNRGRSRRDRLEEPGARWRNRRLPAGCESRRDTGVALAPGIVRDLLEEPAGPGDPATGLGHLAVLGQVAEAEPERRRGRAVEVALVERRAVRAFPGRLALDPVRPSMWAAIARRRRSSTPSAIETASGSESWANASDQRVAIDRPRGRGRGRWRSSLRLGSARTLPRRRGFAASAYSQPRRRK